MIAQQEDNVVILSEAKGLMGGPRFFASLRMTKVEIASVDAQQSTSSFCPSQISESAVCFLVYRLLIVVFRKGIEA